MSDDMFYMGLIIGLVLGALIIGLIWAGVSTTIYFTSINQEVTPNYTDYDFIIMTFKAINQVEVINITELDNLFSNDNVRLFCQEKNFTSGWFGCSTGAGITCNKDKDGWTKYECFKLSELIQWRLKKP